MADPRRRPEEPTTEADAADAITDDERRLTELLVERFGPRARRRHPHQEPAAEGGSSADEEDQT
jgi:hypothetical protein